MSQPAAPENATPTLEIPPTINGAERFFRAWATQVIRFRWLLLALTLVSTGSALYAIKMWLRVDNSTEAFLSSEDDSSVVLEELRDSFGQDTLFQVLVEGDVFTLEYLGRLKKLHEELEKLNMDVPSLGHRVGGKKRSAANEADKAGEAGQTQTTPNPDLAGFGDDEGWGDEGGADGEDGWGDEGGGSIVDEVTSLLNARHTSWKNGGMDVSGLLDTWPTEAELPALKKQVLSDKTLLGNVIGKGAKHSVIVVRTDFMNEADSGRVYLELLEIIKKHEAPGFHLEVAGAPALFVSLNQRMMEDLGLTFGVSNLLMLFILWLMFRHPIGMLAPIAVCVQAAVMTMGVLAVSGRPITMITNVLPAFLVCVGVGDSIHVQSVYRDARKRGMTNTDAIVYAIGSTGIPVLFTSLTTAIGLFSFRFAHLEAVQDMGVFGAFGVMAALLNSVVLLPIALTFNKKSLLGVSFSAHKRDWVDRMLGVCNDLSAPASRTGRKHSTRRHVMVLGALLAIVAIPAAATMGVYHNPLQWFPDDDPTRLAIDHLDEHVGGMATIALLIEAPEGQNLKQRETLVGMEKLEQHILAYRDPERSPDLISNSTSLVDVVRESWRAVHENDPKQYRLPDEERGVLDMLTLFENAGPEQLSRLATIDLSKSLMMVRAKWIDAWAYRPLVDHINAGAAKFLPSGVTVKATGTVYSTVAIVSTLLMDLLQSFGTAFIVITIFMIFLLRDLKLGVIAMAPNLMPILAVIAYMRAAGIPVDTNTLMVASIGIGIAVDDTIHFLHQFKAHYTKHGDVDAAIGYSLSHTGRAMVSTSVILFAGFIALNVGYMGNVRSFGTLISMTVTFALFFDLIFCPALLRTVYRSRKPVTA